MPVCTITNTADNQAEFPLGNFVKCVDNFDNGSFSATFGYYNPNPITVSVAPGRANSLSPGGPDRKQPTKFQQGTVSAAFTIANIPAGTSVTWTVANVPGTSDRRRPPATFTTKCTPDPPPARPNARSSSRAWRTARRTFSATFGYRNAESAPVPIPIGPQNPFEPDPVNRGQPIEFAAGDHLECGHRLRHP